jgi:16S rRNA (guanine966-N2)-methyltransferase
MIRLTGGDWRGRSIAVPRGDTIRPTGSKVRGALFDMLAPSVPDGRFVDLCCGAGTMGLEALSRGAAHAVFVDSGRRALAALRDNLLRLQIERDRVTLCVTDALRWARGPEPGGDIVFCDPPYRSTVLRRLLPALAEAGKVLPGGWLVAETSKTADLEELGLMGLSLERMRQHGDTRLWLWHRDPRPMEET